MNSDIKYVNWDYFTNWANITKNVQGACYAFVFNETKPQNYNFPYEYENCVYVGKSCGMYADTLGTNGHKHRIRSYLHSRMSEHYGALVSGKKTESSHEKIIETFGSGKDVMDGTLTNLPMWLGIILPRDDVKNTNAWSHYMERQQIYYYTQKWDKTPIGNLDTSSKSKRVLGSKSSLILERKKTSLDEFFIDTSSKICYK